MASELEESRLFRVQFQLEFRHAFGEFFPELFSFRLELESNHDIVSVAHHDHIAVRTLLTPCLDPKIKDVVKVDIRQQGRCASALRPPEEKERNKATPRRRIATVIFGVALLLAGIIRLMI